MPRARPCREDIVDIHADHDDVAAVALPVEARVALAPREAGSSELRVQQLSPPPACLFEPKQTLPQLQPQLARVRSALHSQYLLRDRHAARHLDKDEEVRLLLRFDVGVGDVAVIVRHLHVAANARITLTVDRSISPAKMSV